MICEYAMLHMGYLRIDDDQRRQLRAGTLRMGDLQAWRRKRDACTSVPCLDAVFAEWWRQRSDEADRRPASRAVVARQAGAGADRRTNSPRRADRRPGPLPPYRSHLPPPHRPPCCPTPPPCWQ